MMFCYCFCCFTSAKRALHLALSLLVSTLLHSLRLLHCRLILVGRLFLLLHVLLLCVLIVHGGTGLCTRLLESWLRRDWLNRKLRDRIWACWLGWGIHGNSTCWWGRQLLLGCLDLYSLHHVCLLHVSGRIVAIASIPISLLIVPTKRCKRILICRPVLLVSILQRTIVHHGYICHHVLWLCPGYHHTVHGLFLHGIAGEGVGDRCGLHLAHLHLQLLTLILVRAPIELLLHDADNPLILGRRVLAVVVSWELNKLLVIGLSHSRLSFLGTRVDARSDWKDNDDKCKDEAA